MRKRGVNHLMRGVGQVRSAATRSGGAIASVIFSLYLDQIIKPMSALHLIKFGSLAGDDKSVN